jgi:hypothetical protein
MVVRLIKYSNPSVVVYLAVALIAALLLPLRPYSAQAAPFAAPSVAGFTGVREGESVRGTLGIQAQVSGGNIAQVVFKLAGPRGYTWTEKNAPYYFMGNSPNGDPLGWKTTEYPDGAYTLTATATNTAGQNAAAKVSFRIANSSPGPKVTGFNGVTEGQALKGVAAIEAVVEGSNIAEVAFKLDGPKTATHAEQTAPYFFFGDRNGTPLGWNTAGYPNGTYKLTATVKNTSGQTGSYAVNFTIANGSQPTPTTPPAPTPTPGQGGNTTNPPALLRSYIIQGQPPAYELIKYRPRQFANNIDADESTKTATINNVGPYAGWDLLHAPNKGTSNIANAAEWFILRLNRPAKMAIAWRGGSVLPNWLKGWTKGADITVNNRTVPTFVRDMPAGEVKLGAVYNPSDTDRPGRDTYIVLLAEANGAPSKAPTIPAGKETPKANQLCPSWVHDQYVTTGPDGKTYATWHPQIDPVYWCYFGHDHGSDPALFHPTYKPPYGYASTTAGFNEPHVGFKTYIVDDQQGNRWLVNHHGGSGGIARACVQHHDVQIAVASKATGEILANLHMIGDFGHSAANRNGQDLTPANCPDQAQKASASTGTRQLPVQSLGLVGYEPWRMDEAGNVFGLRVTGLTFNTPSAVTACNDINCSQTVLTGGDGIFRFMKFDAAFEIKAGANTGEFYTDVYGKALKRAGEAGAIKQFVKPGVNLSIKRPAGADKFWPSDPWQSLYVCQIPETSRNLNLETAVKGAN